MLSGLILRSNTNNKESGRRRENEVQLSSLKDAPSMAPPKDLSNDNGGGINTFQPSAPLFACPRGSRGNGFATNPVTPQEHTSTPSTASRERAQPYRTRSRAKKEGNDAQSAINNHGSQPSSSNTYGLQELALKPTNMKPDPSSQPASSGHSLLAAMTESDHPFTPTKSKESRDRNNKKNKNKKLRDRSRNLNSQLPSSARAQRPGMAGFDNPFSSMSETYDPTFDFNDHFAEASSSKNAQFPSMTASNNPISSIQETYDPTPFNFNEHSVQASSSNNAFSSISETYDPDFDFNGHRAQALPSNQFSSMPETNDHGFDFDFTGHRAQALPSNNQFSAMPETYNRTPFNFNDHSAQASSSTNTQLPAVGSFRPPPGAASNPDPNYTEMDYILSGMRANIRENHYPEVNDGRCINPKQLANLDYTVLPPMQEVAVPEEFWSALENPRGNRAYYNAFMSNPIGGSTPYGEGLLMTPHGAIVPVKQGEEGD